MRFATHIFGVGLSLLSMSAALAGTLAWKVQLPSERLGVSMANDTARHATLMFGGQLRATGMYLGDTWVWDGVKWAQRVVTGPSARSSYAMAFDSARNVTVLFGGKGAGGLSNETWEWNGVTWTQRVVAGPPARSGASMCFDSARNVIVLFGGFTTTYLGDTWEWDGTVWTQRVVTGPAARTGSAFAYDSARGKAVLYGGLRGSPMNGTPLLTSETWTWDGTTWVQLAVAGPQALQNTSAAFDAARGKVVLFGGATSTVAYGGPSNQTWEWNGTTWTKRTNGSARAGHAMAYVPESGGVVVFAGVPTDFNGQIANGDVRLWNGTSWSDIGPHGPRGRADLGMTYNSVLQRSVVMNGYYVESGNFLPIGDAWEWNGARWTSAGNMQGRYRGANAFDSARGKSVYFGGAIEPGAQVTDTIIEWSGPDDFVNPAATGPSGRNWMPMAYDSARNVCVLFGGVASGSPFGDTWEWNGTAWTQRVVSGPAARYGHMMAYDSARGVTVLFGGVKKVNNTQVVTGETWEWDGIAWSERLVSGPPARWNGMMAYDSVRGKTVLYGGGFLTDTWEWDGSAWTQVLINGATPVASASMVYDPERQAMVMFGGEAPSLSYYYSSETWELALICPGDINSDHVVDDADFVSFAAAYDTLDCADPAMALGCPADLNADAVVDDADFVLFANGYDALICS